MKGFAYLFTSFLCLLLGSFIYVLYEPSVFFIRCVFSNSVILSLQQDLSWLTRLLPGSTFVKYHLPDILWYQSLLCIIIYVYYIKKFFHTGPLFYFIALLPFILEFLQLLRFVPGTFDWLDIFFYTILLFINYSLYFGRKKSK
jgi:hypothetical protein